VKEDTDSLEKRLAQLKSAFDSAFALPPEPPAGARRAYLGIRLFDEPYALEVDEVVSVRKHVPVTPLPSEEAHLLGVAGFGGVLAAVYDLGALLGQPRGSAPPWFALVRGAPVAFAFHGLEGQLHTHAEEVAPGDAASEPGGAPDLAWRPGLSRPVIRLRALVARLGGVATDRRMEGAASR
jgi:hypothetical protein